MNDLDWARLQRRAHDVAGLAATYGWDIPPEYGSASAVAYQARQIANEPPPRPTPPTDQQKVTAWVTKAAEARMRHREQTAVAADLDTDAERQAMRAILDETLLASYVANLCDVFVAHASSFDRLVNDEAAPLEITGKHRSTGCGFTTS
jgi:hypothetical protein